MCKLLPLLEHLNLGLYQALGWQINISCSMQCVARELPGVKDMRCDVGGMLSLGPWHRANTVALCFLKT